MLGSNPFYIFLVFRTNSRAVSMFLASSCSWFQDVLASYCVRSIKYISSRKVKKFLPLRKWLAFPNQMSARSQLSLFIGYITKKTQLSLSKLSRKKNDPAKYHHSLCHLQYAAHNFFANCFNWQTGAACWTWQFVLKIQNRSKSSQLKNGDICLLFYLVIVLLLKA